MKDEDNTQTHYQGVYLLVNINLGRAFVSPTAHCRMASLWVAGEVFVAQSKIIKGIGVLAAQSQAVFTT